MTRRRERKAVDDIRPETAWHRAKGRPTLDYLPLDRRYVQDLKSFLGYSIKELSEDWTEVSKEVGAPPLESGPAVDKATATSVQRLCQDAEWLWYLSMYLREISNVESDPQIQPLIHELREIREQAYQTLGEIGERMELDVDYKVSLDYLAVSVMREVVTREHAFEKSRGEIIEDLIERLSSLRAGRETYLSRALEEGLLMPASPILGAGSSGDFGPVDKRRQHLLREVIEPNFESLQDVTPGGIRELLEKPEYRGVLELYEFDPDNEQALYLKIRRDVSTLRGIYGIEQAFSRPNVGLRRQLLLREVIEPEFGSLEKASIARVARVLKENPKYRGIHRLYEPPGAPESEREPLSRTKLYYRVQEDIRQLKRHKNRI